MGTKLKWVETRPVGRAPNVGEIWTEPGYVGLGEDAAMYRSRFSAEYRANGMGKRAPYVVRLPDGSDFVLDFHPGLKISGEGDKLTVDGEINLPGRFVGNIQNGELVSRAEQKQREAPPAHIDDRVTKTER